MKKIIKPLVFSLLLLNSAYATFPESKKIEVSPTQISNELQDNRIVEIESFGEELEKLEKGRSSRQNEIQEKIKVLNEQIEKLDLRATEAADLIKSVRDMLHSIELEIKRTDQLRKVCSDSKIRINKAIYNVLQEYKKDTELNYSNEKLEWEENKMRKRNAHIIRKCEKDISTQLRKELIAKDKAQKLYRIVAPLKGEIALDKEQVLMAKDQLEILESDFRDSLQ